MNRGKETLLGCLFGRAVAPETDEFQSQLDASAIVFADLSTLV
jgi:hypothetical protein